MAWGARTRTCRATLPSRPGPFLSAQNLRSAFLPGNCQGTQINTNNTTIEKLIENIKNHYVTSEEQRSQLDLVEKLNKRFEDDQALDARIQSFELAFQMQTEATDAFDIGREPEYIRKQYAADTPQGRQMLIARRLLKKGSASCKSGTLVGTITRISPTCCARKHPSATSRWRRHWQI